MNVHVESILRFAVVKNVKSHNLVQKLFISVMKTKTAFVVSQFVHQSLDIILVALGIVLNYFSSNYHVYLHV